MYFAEGSTEDNLADHVELIFLSDENPFAIVSPYVVSLSPSVLFD